MGPERTVAGAERPDPSDDLGEHASAPGRGCSRVAVVRVAVVREAAEWESVLGFEPAIERHDLR